MAASSNVDKPLQTRLLAVAQCRSPQAMQGPATAVEERTGSFRQPVERGRPPTPLWRLPIPHPMFYPDQVALAAPSPATAPTRLSDQKRRRCYEPAGKGVQDAGKKDALCMRPRTRKRQNRPTGPCSEALVNPSIDGGTRPWLFRLSGLADIAHRAMYTS